ncbi:MAG: hypothetical protein RJA76_1067 [Bacteroidota bacterium]|jgi:hypothetical protein
MKKFIFLLNIILSIQLFCIAQNNSTISVGNTFKISKQKETININTERKGKAGYNKVIDIENNIAESKSINPNAIAFVIAISDYQNKSIPKVKYAKRDASLMREYLIKRMGFSPNNIFPRSMDDLPTAGYLKTFIKDNLKRILRPDGQSELFIYYTGHGAPSMIKEGSAYLVPFDADPNYLTDLNGYALDEFFNDIGKLPAKKKMVVVDACFSGQSGDGVSLITNSSPLTIKPKIDIFSDENTAIFLSSKSQQVSNWYPEKHHSLFTYYFLKGLQGSGDLNSDGKITLGEMETFINDPNEGIPYISNREFQRDQKADIIGNKQFMVNKN